MSKEISLEDQLRSVTSLLGGLLLLINEPVHLDKQTLRTELKGQIVILDNEEDDEYVLYVEEENA